MVRVHLRLFFGGSYQNLRKKKSKNMLMTKVFFSFLKGKYSGKKIKCFKHILMTHN